MWSVLSALHPERFSSDRTSVYEKFKDELIFADLTLFPLSLDKIPMFGELNSLRVNVYGYDKGFHPLYLTADRSTTDLIHLFLLRSETEGKSHYCWIKNLSRLLSHGAKHNGRAIHCPFCHFGFQSKGRLCDHLQYCQGQLQKIKMPLAGEVLKFKNIKNQLRCSSVVYADFECITPKLDTCEPSGNGPFTSKVQQHTPCGVAAYGILQCCGGTELDEILKSDLSPDCAETFLEAVVEYGKALHDRIDNLIHMKLTAINKQDFMNATTCHICQQGFIWANEEENRKVRDH
jgi:hypothetical protein